MLAHDGRAEPTALLNEILVHFGRDPREVVGWMDSDTVAAASLHPLLEAGARLPAAGSEEPGPRIGAAYDGR